MKKLISLVLALVLTASLMAPVMATGTTPKHTDKAKTLYQLGLFKGTGVNSDGTPIFELDKGATRIQGLVMLIRLLGEEEAALACTAEHPFTDVPSWGEKYVAYAYEQGYTNGVGNNTFGSNDNLLGKAYVTFVLRALGYNDAAGDFSYNNALTFGAELGLLESGTCEGALLRDDCALLSYNAMRTTMKDTDTKLAEKLVNDGVLTDEAVFRAGILLTTFYIPYDKEKNECKVSDITAVLPEAASVENGGHSVIVSSIDWKSYEAIVSLYPLIPNVSRYLKGRISTLPSHKLRDSFGLILDNGNLIAVLDKDWNMIAYCVVPRGTKPGDNLEFVTGFKYNGFDDIKKAQEQVKNVKSYTVDDLFYRENVTTINPDGTENLSQYLCLDVEKLPEELKESAAYYSLYNSVFEAYGLQTDIRKHWSTPEKDTSFLLYLTTKLTAKKIDNEISIWNENRDLIAFVSFDNEITREVETVIDLRVG